MARAVLYDRYSSKLHETERNHGGFRFSEHPLAISHVLKLWVAPARHVRPWEVKALSRCQAVWQNSQPNHDGALNSLPAK